MPPQLAQQHHAREQVERTQEDELDARHIDPSSASALTSSRCAEVTAGT